MDKLRSIGPTLRPSPLMPVLFIGHGNPMNVISDNEFVKQWRSIGINLPDAQAIVVVSAHWMTRGTHITDAPNQQIIYDFYGFPDELYSVQYNAKGSPEIASTLRDEILKYEAALDSSWGLDHGTWTVLKHLVPEPKIPVLQISLDMTLSLPKMYQLFSELKSLRTKGVIFIGSGNIVHNLRLADFTGQLAYDWALEFDTVSKKIIENHDTTKLTNPLIASASAELAIPTDEHYRPLVASMALLNKDEEISFFNEQMDFASVSMRSFITS